MVCMVVNGNHFRKTSYANRIKYFKSIGTHTVHIHIFKIGIIDVTFLDLSSIIQVCKFFTLYYRM